MNKKIKIMIMIKIKIYNKNKYLKNGLYLYTHIY